MIAATLRPAPRDIARMVSIPRIMRHLGWRIRSRSRADCGLCRGGSKGTVAYRDHVWHCHRCQQGGDIFKLVMAVNNCEFRAALAYVAELAGIRLEDSSITEVRRDLVARQQQRERIEAAADKLTHIECALRLESRDRICRAERTLMTLRGATVWTETDWLTAAECFDALQRDFAAYTLLSWGAPAARTRYVLHAELRAQMVAVIHWAGGLPDDHGRWVEVTQ